jgi:hypothetical protein
VDREIVLEVAKDFDLGEKAASRDAPSGRPPIALQPMLVTPTVAPEGPTAARDVEPALIDNGRPDLFSSSTARPRRFSLFRGWNRTASTT